MNPFEHAKKMSLETPTATLQVATTVAIMATKILVLES